MCLPCTDAERNGEMISSVSMSPSWSHGSSAQQWPSGPAGGAWLIEHKLELWLAKRVFSLDNDYGDEMGCSFLTWV